MIQQPPPALAPPMEMDSGPLYSVKIRRRKKRGYICVDALPPEEFLTERRAVTLDKDKCFFTAHRCRRTVSDLIEMGYEKKIVMSLPGSDDLENNPEVINRFFPEDEDPRRDGGDLDPAMRGVWVAENFLKIDYDGDGIAEWRKVTLAGGGGLDILTRDGEESAQEADGHPFVAWTPYKQPHKLYGESMADKTMDIQLIKSTVWRQILDGMYFNNAPQLVVQEGQANMEDVLTRRPGGVIRVRSQGAVTPLPVQDSSASGFSMISMLDSIRETRTGIRRFSSGIEADALNPYASTATGAAMVDDASQDAIMLIARNFAEMGLKPLFKRMLELTCKYQDRAQTIRLRGKWVDIDPSTWNTEMDMTVTVGLGTGNRDRQVGQLMQMMTQIDVPLVQAQGGPTGPILTMDNIYNKLKKLQEAMGYKEADGFYSDPATAPPQPPKGPSPEEIKQQGELAKIHAQGLVDVEVERLKAEANDRSTKVDAEMRTRADVVIAQHDAEIRLQIEREKMAQERELRLEEIASKERLEREKMAHEHNMAVIKVAGPKVVEHALGPTPHEQAQLDQDAENAKAKAKEPE